MSWANRVGIFVDLENGNLLFPWEYSLQWNTDVETAALIYKSEHIYVYYCDQAKIEQQLHDQSLGKLWKLGSDDKFDISNCSFPGGSTFWVEGKDFTNGTTRIALRGVEVIDKNGKVVLCVSNKEYEVQATDEHIERLKRLSSALVKALQNIDTPRDLVAGADISGLMRGLGWFYFLCAVVAGFVVLTQFGEITVSNPYGLDRKISNPLAISYAIGLWASGLLSIVILHFFAALNDNLRALTKKLVHTD
jgi:hypothetical protein